MKFSYKISFFLKVVPFFFLILGHLQVQGQEPSIVVEGQVQERGHPEKKIAGNLFVFPGPIKVTANLQGKFSVQVPCNQNLRWVLNFAGYQKWEQSDFIPSPKLSVSRINSSDIIDKNPQLTSATSTTSATSATSATPTSLKRNFFLSPAEFKNGYETVVTGKTDVFSAPKTLSGQKLKNSVGTNQDALLGVENVAGIGNLSTRNNAGKYGSPGTGMAFSSFPQLTIQGAEPFFNRFLFEGHPIPFFQYTIRMQSVLPIESIEQLRVYNSGMAANMGRQLGGFLEAQLGNPPDAQAPHFRARLALGTMEFAHENSSNITADTKSNFRYGFFIRKGTGVLALANLIYWVLKLTAPDSTNLLSNSSTGNYISFPDTLDIFMYLRGKLNENFRYSINFLTANQTFALKFGNQFALDNGSKFFTLLPKVSYRISESQELDISAAVTYSDLLSSASRQEKYDNFQSEKSWYGSLRALWQVGNLGSFKPRLGLDYLNSWHNFKLVGIPNVFSISEQYTFQMLNPLGSDFPLLPPINEVRLNGHRNEYAHFADVLWKATPEVSVYVGLRHESFKNFSENYLDPRLRISNKWFPNFTSQLNWGAYHQANALWMSDPNLGNPQLTAMNGSQWYWVNELDLSQAYFLPKGMRNASLKMNFFARNYSQIATLIDSTKHFFNLEQENWSALKNQGSGRSLGLEIEAFFENSFFEASSSYTWSQNLRRLASDMPEFLSPYSNAHIWRTLLNFPLSNRLKIGARISVLSGLPYSQVSTIDLYRDGTEVYTFLKGPLGLSSPWQYQIDLRMDSITYFKTMKLQYFLELKDAFNWLTARPELPTLTYRPMFTNYEPSKVGVDQFASKTAPSVSLNGANFFNYFPLPSFGVFLEF